MGDKFDTIIIGAGIAGLLTAIRLSQKGQRVLVVEKNKIGSGSTSSNHGMIHSGALFVSQHGHIVKNCQEAQGLFMGLVSQAELPTDDSIYIGTEKQLDKFVKLLKKHNLDWKSVSTNDVTEVNPAVSNEYSYIGIKERVFSSAKILKILTSYCLANDVEFILGSEVSRIKIKSGKTVGVVVGNDQFIASENVVIATGLGTTSLLKSFNSYYCQFLKSRLDMMVHLQKSDIKRGLLFMELDKPILMPAKNKSVLGSYFGGIQPRIKGDRKFPVDFDKARNLIEMIGLYFKKEVIKTEGASFYMCGKTDFVGDKNTKKGFINPGFRILDHQVYDSMDGLYTIVTGKMVLAFHASREISEKILGSKLDLHIEQKKRVDTRENMLAPAPWASLDVV